MSYSILIIAAVIVLVFSLWAGYYSKRWATAGGIIAFVAFLSFAHIDKISEISASIAGLVEIALKIRDVNEVVEEGRDTIQALQKLTSIMGSVTLSLTKRVGRAAATYSDEELERIRQEVLEVFDKVGVSEEEQKAALKEWHEWDDFDYVTTILSAAGRQELQSVPGWDEVAGSWPGDHIAGPDELADFLKRAGKLTPEIERRIEDYRYYQKYRKHRGP